MAEKENKRPGQPTKCTPELTAQFAKYMGAGLYFQDACDLCHIGRRTGYRWLEWGEAAFEEADGDLAAVPENKQPYAQFWHTVCARAASALARNAALIQQSAQDRKLPKKDEDETLVLGDWRAAAWFLEHRRPDTWGKREQKTELTGKDGGPMQVEHWWQETLRRNGDEGADDDGDAGDTAEGGG